MEVAVSNTLIPGHFHQLLWEDPETFPNQLSDIISPQCPGSISGSPSGWMCLARCPNQWGAAALLWGSPRCLSPISRAEPSHLVEKTSYKTLTHTAKHSSQQTSAVCVQDPEIFKLLYLGEDQEWIFHPVTPENHGISVWDSHVNCFTLRCKPSQCKLGSQYEDYIVCENMHVIW